MIAGTRGVPAQHGGFETFTERFALFLVEKGWSVTVFCQVEGAEEIHEDYWKGIHRLLIPINQSGAIGTILFDWRSTRYAARHADIVLVLGYNTAIFSALYKLMGIPNIFNMDGVEWMRAKWKWWQKLWLYCNERVAGLAGTRLVADHPCIRDHLTHGIFGRKDIAVIPYGADRVNEADASCLSRLDVTPRKYALVIARPEPENQILEIVRAFSSKERGYKLVILGSFNSSNNEYHRKIILAASNEVIFPGPIYDKAIVNALRYYASLYIHGHTVGGTNPTLVEALGAGSPIMAHDNKYNRWVAGNSAEYFNSEDECAFMLEKLMNEPDRLKKMKVLSYQRHHEAFKWETILTDYENILIDLITKRRIHE